MFFKVTSAKHRLGLGQSRTTLYTMTTRLVTLWPDFGCSASSAAINVW